MQKLLIYFPERKLKPSGGPAGYLYNLYKGLKKINLNEYSLQIDFYNSGSATIEENSSLKRKMPRRVLELRRALKDTKLLEKRKAIDKSMYQYDMIHFHWTEDMYLNRDFLQDYKGKVILTSHSPCVYNVERIGKLNPFDYKLLRKKIDNLVEMDRYCFERADYIIFPCEEAEEPYYHTWNQYKSIRQAKKYHYLPTGIVGCNSKIKRVEYRKMYNIPEDAFVISYAGRHNEIKGYGDLKKIGHDLIKDKNVYFLIAGREEPIRGLDDDHWIEVGWTTDPHSLIAASDVFVLPNHETYFDLILLEVLSLGVPLVISRTGGNKYFEKYNSKGMKFYNTLEEAKEKIKEFQFMGIEERMSASQDLIEIFQKDFTVDVFTGNYVDTICDIANDGVVNDK